MKLVAFTAVNLLSVALVVFANSSKKVSVHDSAKIRATLNSAERVYVYEGLPHQMFEPELLEAEKKRKDILKIANFPFYTPKVEVKGRWTL